MNGHVKEQRTFQLQWHIKNLTLFPWKQDMTLLDKSFLMLYIYTVQTNIRNRSSKKYLVYLVSEWRKLNTFMLLLSERYTFFSYWLFFFPFLHHFHWCSDISAVIGPCKHLRGHTVMLFDVSLMSLFEIKALSGCFFFPSWLSLF